MTACEGRGREAVLIKRNVQRAEDKPVQEQETELMDTMGMVKRICWVGRVTGAVLLCAVSIRPRPMEHPTLGGGSGEERAGQRICAPRLWSLRVGTCTRVD